MRMRSRQAFTLLEVLLAVTIAVILTATLAGTITIAFRLKKESEYAVESVHDLQVAGEEWSREVMCALPPNPSSSADPNTVTTGTTATTGTTGTTGTTATTVTPGVALFTRGAFYGDRETMRFFNTNTNPKSILKSDVKYVEFLLELDDDGTYSLVRRTNENLLGADEVALQMTTEMEVEVLVKHVTSISFVYYDETFTALDTWDSLMETQLNSLPYAVEMVLTLPGYSARDPDRVIHRFAMLMCAAPVPVEDTTATTGTTGTTGTGN